MSVTEFSALKDLRDALQSIINGIAKEGAAAGTPNVELERPRDETHGDYATNAALMLAPVLRRNPREVATEIVELASTLPGVASIDIAGPGFINIRMKDEWFLGVIASVLDAGEAYGSNVVLEPLPILLEYVSANPTGPMVAASTRHAAFGDSLARLLRHAGHHVITEYYVNDAGNQANLFGESIFARATGGEVPEGGYEGDYVTDLAKELSATKDDDAAELGRRGIDKMVESIQTSLARLDVHFDRFQRERELHDNGSVDAAINYLIEHGETKDEDGAVLLRTTSYGDDRDRAIRRSNGVPTYFAADIAFLKNKFNRVGEEGHLIYVLGADHHGYIARLKAAASALGYSAENCEIVIMQMVSLLENGELKKMSKRRGDIVLSDELVDRIGSDAARYFMLQRSNDQQVDLDLDLAESESDANPVYYVQYAHARLCSIRRKVEESLGAQSVDSQAIGSSISEPLHDSEKRVVKRIGEFPILVADASERRQPHRLVHYSYDLASDVAKFYRDCRVMGDDIPTELTVQRLAVADAARTVLALALSLAGVSAPERM